MGQIHTRAVKGLSRAPYRSQVEVHMIDMGFFTGVFTAQEEAKIARVQRFLSAYDCAREISDAREKLFLQ
jgi:hypothetical protein